MAVEVPTIQTDVIDTWVKNIETRLVSSLTELLQEEHKVAKEALRSDLQLVNNDLQRLDPQYRHYPSHSDDRLKEAAVRLEAFRAKLTDVIKELHLCG